MQVKIKNDKLVRMALEDYQKIYFNPDIVNGKTCPKYRSNDILFIAYGLLDPEVLSYCLILHATDAKTVFLVSVDQADNTTIGAQV